MKKSLILLTVAALASSLFLSCNGNKEKNAASGPRKIIIGTGGNTPPATYRNEKDELIGYETDLAREIFSRLPQYEIEFVVASDTLTGLDAGLYQASYNIWGYNRKRADKYIFSDVESIIPHSIVVRDDNTEINSVFDLGGHTTLTIPGNANDNTYRLWNERHPEKKINIKYVESTGNFLLSVLNKDIDFYYHSTTTITAQLERTKLTGLRVIDIPESENHEFSLGIPGSHFYFPKGEEKLRDDFNWALKEAVKDGSVKRIFEKYYPELEYLLSEQAIDENTALIKADLAEAGLKY